MNIELSLIRFGNTLKFEREKQNLTYDTIKQSSGLTASTISKIESGKNVTFESIIKYLNSIGYNVAISKQVNPGCE